MALHHLSLNPVVAGEKDHPIADRQVRHARADGFNPPHGLDAQRLRLRIDARVAGASTDRLAACLAPGATVVVYGAMSGEAVALNPGSLVFHDVVVRGFWLTRYLATAPRSEIVQLYADVQRILSRLQAPPKVAAVYPADEIKAAVAQAVAAESGAKVFVTFGPDTAI